MSKKIYEEKDGDRVTVEADGTSVLVAREKKNARGRFKVEEEVCLLPDTWRRIIADWTVKKE